jgi:integrase
VYVAGACGLRFSEVAALRVGRVDVAHLRLQVLETAPQVGGDRAEPKTAAGRRTVPVPGLIAEVLDEHLNRHGLAGEADALVFSAERGRAPSRRQLAQACLGTRSTGRRVAHAEIS